VADHMHTWVSILFVSLLTPAIKNYTTFIKMQTVYESTFRDLNLRYTFNIINTGKQILIFVAS
jgi:hypothetical protein